ncbi:hypothetical protein [Cyclobacterium marinum]|uniref:Uncharacterized protein n=1 Tax=Cyclobacterium marinum (strain ATCC 25205 / DSM 745 / LMG 13164 / NCIMB 1802) TaxID=880070 RepID=G0J1Y7_CYCMS|nr:hypothetical protein [Cyclobacterium marinum]AEL23993.1 hypothetical protein Cycma_0211 [Cyclobacterium marinum DSM 745]
MENKEQNTEDFSIIFEKLAVAKDEQKINGGLSESEFSDIHSSVQKLQEIQQSVESTSYTLFTRA